MCPARTFCVGKKHTEPLQSVYVRTRRRHFRAQAEDITRTNGPWLTLAVIESEIFVEGCAEAARWNGTCYHLGAHIPAAMMAPPLLSCFLKVFLHLEIPGGPRGRAEQKKFACAPEIWEFKYAQRLLFAWPWTEFLFSLFTSKKH